MKAQLQEDNSRFPLQSLNAYLSIQINMYSPVLISYKLHRAYRQQQLTLSPKQMSAMEVSKKVKPYLLSQFFETDNKIRARK